MANPKLSPSRLFVTKNPAALCGSCHVNFLHSLRFYTIIIIIIIIINIIIIYVNREKLILKILF